MIPKSMIASVYRSNQGEVTKFTLTNGSILKLMSYEQHLKKAASQVSPFEGHMWDYVHFDEPPPYGVFTACHRGIIAREGRMAFTLTPLACPWLYDKLYLKSGNLFDDGRSSIYSIHVKIHDNPYLSKEYIENYLAGLSSDEREAREFGNFMHLVGLVYKGYEPEAHRLPRKSVKIEAHWPKGMVMDPHDRKPCAIAWFAVTPENDIIFFDEWPKTPFADMRSDPLKHSVPKYAQMIRDTEKSIPGGSDSLIYRLMDPNFGRSGKMGSVDASLVDAFARERLYFMTDIKDDVREGHMEVSKRLDWNRDEPMTAINKPKLFVTDDCYNLNYGLTHYIWEEWRQDGKGVKEKPSEEFKDFPDLVRYTCVFNPRFFDVAATRRIDPRVRTIKSMANSGLG